MAGTGSGSGNSAGLMDFATAVLPIALSIAPNNPQAGHMMTLLAALSKGREDRAREDEERAATARSLGTLGFQVDPSTPSATQAAIANIQLGTRKTEREQAEQARSREVFGRIATERSRIPEDLPEASRARLAALAPELGRAPELREGFDKSMAEVAQQEKRLSTARRLAKPYETTETYSFGTPPPPVGEAAPTFDRPLPEPPPFTLGAGPLTLPPPMRMTTVPENVHGLQRQVMETGEVPTPTEAEQAGVDLTKFPGGREAMVKRRREEAELRQTEALGRKTEAEAGALEVGAPFRAEMEILKVQKLRQEVEQGRMPPLTGDIVNRLRSVPGVDPRNPTPEQVAQALSAHESALMKRAVDAATQQGLAAASIPARTPDAARERLVDLAQARSVIGELNRLAPNVNMPRILGGLSPWVNQIMQTGRAGPIPIPAGDLTPDQNRFLTLTKNYADTVLRMRSKSQTSEAEMQRMLGFLMDPSLTAATYVARMQLESDLLRIRGDIEAASLTESGYRSPRLPSPPLSQGPPAILGVERER